MGCDGGADKPSGQQCSEEVRSKGIPTKRFERRLNAHRPFSVNHDPKCGTLGAAKKIGQASVMVCWQTCRRQFQTPSLGCRRRFCVKMITQPSAPISLKCARFLVLTSKRSSSLIYELIPRLPQGIPFPTPTFASGGSRVSVWEPCRAVGVVPRIAKPTLPYRKQPGHSAVAEAGGVAREWDEAELRDAEEGQNPGGSDTEAHWQMEPGDRGRGTELVPVGGGLTHGPQGWPSATPPGGGVAK